MFVSVKSNKKNKKLFSEFKKLYFTFSNKIKDFFPMSQQFSSSNFRITFNISDILQEGSFFSQRF